MSKPTLKQCSREETHVAHSSVLKQKNALQKQPRSLPASGPCFCGLAARSCCHWLPLIDCECASRAGEKDEARKRNQMVRGLS
jgi:hypothetical protein